METVDAKGLKARIASGEQLVLVDVREPEELRGELGHIPNIVHIPLGQLPTRVGELPDKDSTVVMICKMGGRATRGGEFLEQNGFKKVIVAGRWNDRLERAGTTSSVATALPPPFVKLSWRGGPLCPPVVDCYETHS